MSDVILSKRRFLVGLASSVAAVAGARQLKAAPDLKPIGDIGHMSGYAFQVLPDIHSALPHDRQRIPVLVKRHGGTAMMQIEQGGFPTSFIPAGDEPRTRAADYLKIDSPNGFFDFTKNTPETYMSGFHRASESWVVNDDGSIIRFAVNEPRITSRGLLFEGSRTNLLLHSNDVWDKQSLWLAPGSYVVSWYGDGHVKIDSESVALIRNIRLEATTRSRRIG